jgi:hypothetical protein
MPVNLKEIPTLPIAGWELKTMPEYEVLLISFSYLANMMQTPEQAVMDRTYVIHKNQARELAQKILALLNKMENELPPKVTGKRH